MRVIFTSFYPTLFSSSPHVPPKLLLNVMTSSSLIIVAYTHTSMYTDIHKIPPAVSIECCLGFHAFRAGHLVLDYLSGDLSIAIIA